MPGISGDISDSELVQMARAGNSGAFDALVNRYFGLVYVAAYSRLGHRETSEDLAQEVFLKAYLHLDKLEVPAGFPGWVRTMTRNLAVDWARQGRRSSELVSMVDARREVDDLPDPRAEGAREAMETRESLQGIREAINSLPPAEREVVLLHYLGDLSKSEAARQLGLHPATVARQLKRAVEMLRKSMDPGIRDSVRELGPRPSAAARTLGLVAAASVLPSASKAALVSAAGSALSLTAAETVAGAAAGGGAASGVAGISSLANLFVLGGKTMGLGKVIVGAAAALAVVGGGTFYYVNQSGGGRPVAAIAAPPAKGRAASAPAASVPAASVSAVSAPAPSKQSAIPAAPTVTSSPAAPSSSSSTSELAASDYSRWEGVWRFLPPPPGAPVGNLAIRGASDGKLQIQMVSAVATGSAPFPESLARFPNLKTLTSSGTALGPAASMTQELGPNRLMFLSGTIDDTIKTVLEYVPADDHLLMTLAMTPKTVDGKGAEQTLGPWTLTRTPAALSGQDASEAFLLEGISRCKSNMRFMATGLESYFVDYNTYPLPDVSGSAMAQLTSPVPYIKAALLDPFASREGETFRYFRSSKGPFWAVVSPGPDGVYDVTDSVFRQIASQSNPQVPSTALAPYLYDPTNGSISGGDLIRVKQ